MQNEKGQSLLGAGTPTQFCIYMQEVGTAPILVKPGSFRNSTYSYRNGNELQEIWHRREQEYLFLELTTEASAPVEQLES